MEADGGVAAQLLREFISITGASESVGKHMLEACSQNLEMAVTMFLDGGGIAEEPSTSSAGASTARPAAEDDVRAPIPQKQEILVEPEMFGVRQEQELRNGGAVDKKLTTLADLFRPPIDLMHKGSFETAKECGQLKNKWLMINIQNVQDFACQCLNRDIWSNDSVKSLIREHFIFWQVYHDSEEGQRYIQFYKLSDFPYVSILDPRTGQKMVEWHKLDVNSFLEQVTGFLSEHGQLDGLSSSPPKKRLRSESLIDASEDSQLEAAIRASLQETHFDSSAGNPSTRHEEESDTELYSGSEEFISVCGSDHEEEEEERPPESLPEQETSNSKSRKATSKSISHRKDDLSRAEPVVEEAEEDSDGSLIPEIPNLDSPEIKSNFGIDESSEDCPDTSNGPKAKLMLRYPDGKREQISLPEKAKLMALVKHVQQKGYPNERFELLTNFPRRKLSHLDYDVTLQDAGLCPQETVFVQERN
ncbi:UBX domain-containing protein 7 isoform X2 [Hyla sarda]|uniref:UBX domain-containing protein 7 isoform X2 n=1 Tax=Hyla sarda TaxID=327740 RepID=UPI0024C363B9|nr:UBX domain-containing protein 7 isoform X2 [Hyla sarda]